MEYKTRRELLKGFKWKKDAVFLNIVTGLAKIKRKIAKIVKDKMSDSYAFMSDICSFLSDNVGCPTAISIPAFQQGIICYENLIISATIYENVPTDNLFETDFKYVLSLNCRKVCLLKVCFSTITLGKQIFFRVTQSYKTCNVKIYPDWTEKNVKIQHFCTSTSLGLEPRMGILSIELHQRYDT